MPPFSTDDLWAAWERVRDNEGCAGADGVTIHIFAQRAHRLIPDLEARVRDGRYRPYPLLKIVVEKKPGSAATRTLLVPAVRDRILQTAAARHLSRSFEEEFLECSYGYRPGRSVDRAIARIRKCRELGYVYVMDGDVEAFFDRVDHSLLLARLAERQPGEDLMRLLRLWVSAHVWDGFHIYPLRRGVPQGSPISPLLANFFLEDFDRELEKSGRKLIRYADDFIILAKTQSDAEAAMTQSAALLAAAHLELNRDKTQVVDFARGFRFLGALFLGDAIWVPWKHAHAKGRILFMARPLPPARRAAYEFAPPRGAVEIALEKADATTLPPPPAQPPITRNPSVAFLYLTEQGAVLRKAGDRFLVDKDDEVLLDLPYHKLENVLLFGNVQVTTQALAELLEKGVNLSLFSRQGHYRGSLAPPRGHNIELRIKQFETCRDAARALGVARAIVEAKVANGLAVLAHYREKNQVSAGFDAQRAQIENTLEGCPTADAIASLDGMEGSAARAYFACLMEFNRSPMTWPGRRKHPSTDPLNALLSLTYTLLMHELTGLLEGAGLDPYLGFLHQVDQGRPSLALDLMEPFRHPVADRLVLTLVNRGIIGEEDFHAVGAGAGMFLGPAPMKRYLAEYERWMLDRPSSAGGAQTRPRFRDALKTEVERIVAALREGRVFVAFRWEKPEEGGPCSTSSVTM
jgi:CRISPR-associated protein Cas1